MNKDIAKRNAAEEAVKYVKNGMVVGLGTGSTAKIAVDLIGDKLNEDLLHDALGDTLVCLRCFYKMVMKKDIKDSNPNLDDISPVFKVEDKY